MPAAAPATMALGVDVSLTVHASPGPLLAVAAVWAVLLVLRAAPARQLVRSGALLGLAGRAAPRGRPSMPRSRQHHAERIPLGGCRSASGALPAAPRRCTSCAAGCESSSILPLWGRGRGCEPKVCEQQPQHDLCRSHPRWRAQSTHGRARQFSLRRRFAEEEGTAIAVLACADRDCSCDPPRFRVGE